MSVKFHEAYALDSQQDQLLWWDDFLGDQIQDEWREAGTGSAAVIDQQTGGILRITTGATTNDNYYIDWNNIRSLLVSNRLSFETRVKPNHITNVEHIMAVRSAFNETAQLVFNDTISANWLNYTRTVAAGANQTDTGIAADTNYHVFRIECHTHGANHVHFYIDGTETANSPHTTSITTTYLQPRFSVLTLNDAIKSMDIDYCVVRQDV